MEESNVSQLILTEDPTTSSGTNDSERVRLGRSRPPEPSCLSMKSDGSMYHPINFRGAFSGDSRVQLGRSRSPEPSCLSMKSDGSMYHPINLRGAFSGDSRSCNSSTDPSRVRLGRSRSPEPSCLSMKSDGSMYHPINFRGAFYSDPRTQVSVESCSQLEKTNQTSISALAKKGSLVKHHDILKVSQIKSCGRKRDTLYMQRKTNLHQPTNSFEMCFQKNKPLSRDLQKNKCNMKKKYESIFEGSAHQSHPTLLNEIYTELYITEGGIQCENYENELRHIETASKIQETAIVCNDIFKPLFGQRQVIRTVLTKGTAGIGKTVSVQKFILDWAEKRANQDVHFIFPIPFRDLNLKKGKQFSLIQLLQHYFPELKEADGIECDGIKVVFILDGLDECRLSLDFHSNTICCDVTETTAVEILLTNLIKGNLLPSALLWITSRPAAANQIPPDCVHRVTEIRGFNDPQKEKYFRKRIRDEHMASRMISHIKSSRSLYTMCHIPVFCWISSTVLETMLAEADRDEIPTTLTGMYTHFLLIQTSVKNQKYLGTEEANSTMSDAEIILKLGQLAFEQLEKGNLIFYEEDLKECGIDVNEASVYSGLCTVIFKEEAGLYGVKVYCFVHLSIQEYLAALFVLHSFVSEQRNVLKADQSKSNDGRGQLSDLHRIAVDKALQSKTGHLNLFLRFLLGLSLDTNQNLLKGLLPLTKPRSHITEETVQYIKKMIREESSAERVINLFHCLNELNDNSLVEDIQASLRSGTLSGKKLEPDQCSALAFVLLMSEERLDEFDLKTYNTSAVGQERFLPLVNYCRKAILDCCSLTQKSCRILASALQSVPSHLRELNLSHNNLGVSGMELLYPGLMSPNCKLERLHLCNSDLGETGVKLFKNVLMSPSCKLHRLDVCNNNLGNSQVKLLCEGLSHNCTLQSLELSSCKVTERACAYLASALGSNMSKIKELDLRNNHFGDSGVRELSVGLKSPKCTLETLFLGQCDLTESCCEDLASVLRLPYSKLTELELRDNDIQDSGVKSLCTGLGDPHCKLQSLNLSGCQVTEEGCDFLASALLSNPSHLRELDLSYNHPGVSGVRALSAGLEEPSCKLEKLLVDHGGENRNKPGLRKYAFQLTLDPNTANRNLLLSEGDRTVTLGTQEVQYPDHPERFDQSPQVLCREGLCGRYYWEVEWSGGGVDVGVAYEGISRKGGSEDCELGQNKNSWTLYYNQCHYSVCHNKKKADIPAFPYPSRRIGVYLDWPAGRLSFYSISSQTVTPLHTFYTKFTEPLYPGFYVWSESSVSLCQLD